jgi:hypothetical protein
MHSACSSAFLWVYNLGLCDMLASLWRRFAPGGPPEEPVSLSLADAAAATQWPVRPGLLVTRDVVPDELSVDIFPTHAPLCPRARQVLDDGQPRSAPAQTGGARVHRQT